MQQRIDSDTGHGAAAGGVSLATRTKVAVLVALCLGQFMNQLDITIVNVALPSLAQDLNASTAELQWVVDGYSLALGTLLLIGGRLGDRSGHKRLYLIGLVVFGIGSALCAVATSGAWLVAFRVLQGIGGAIELPATLAILSHSFPDRRERAQAVGIWAGAAGSSLVIGPLLGGALIAAFSWQAVFLVNVPIVIIVGALTLVSVTERIEPDPGRLDVPGQILGTAGLALLAAGAIEGGHDGFTSAIALGLFAGGVVCVAAFVAVERVAASPMLPLGLFRRPAFTAANVNGLVMGFLTIGVLFLFALFFQQVQGDSAIVAGLRYLPLTVAFVLAGPLVGRVLDRTGYWTPMAVGCALMGLGAFALLRVGPTSGYGSVWWPFALIGIGYGLTSTPMASAVLEVVPSNRAGLASSTNLGARLIGGVFGIAVLGALLPSGGAGATRSPAFAQEFVDGLHEALVVAGVAAIAGALLAAVFIRPGNRRHDQPAAPAGQE